MKAVVDERFGKIHRGNALPFIVENAFVQAGPGIGQVERVLQLCANIIGVQHSRLRHFSNTFGPESADVGIGSQEHAKIAVE